MGYALYQAQVGQKAPTAKTLARIWWGRRSRSSRGSSGRHLSSGLHGELFELGLRATRLSEEVQERHRDAEIGSRPYQPTTKGCRGRPQGAPGYERK